MYVLAGSTGNQRTNPDGGESRLDGTISSLYYGIVIAGGQQAGRVLLLWALTTTVASNSVS